MVEKSRVAVAAARLRRNEVSMIEDIKHFGSKLNIESFRNVFYREVLQDRKVHVRKMWPIDAVSKNFARS